MERWIIVNKGGVYVDRWDESTVPHDVTPIDTDQEHAGASGASWLLDVHTNEMGGHHG
jgi:hypothetical protein